MTKTATISGIKVRTSSNRRFVVIRIHNDRGYVEARSDSWSTIKARAAKIGGFIWDTATGEVFDWAGREI